jgi:hypothetical protein
MPDPIIPPPKPGSRARLNYWALSIWVAGTLMILALAWATWTDMTLRSQKVVAMGYCKQIINMCRLYSSDASGTFPDSPDNGVVPKTANEAFRRLFKMGICDYEMVFGCPLSPFEPDGNIGTAPDWVQALQKGENHWALVAGLDDSSSGLYPLILENPVDDSMPPSWNADAAGQKRSGRCWPDGKVLVGFIDGSVMFMPLEARSGQKVPLKPRQGSRPEDDPELFLFGNVRGDGLHPHVLPVEQ